MGTQLACPKRGRAPEFSAHFYCGQTAGCRCIKMTLVKEIGLSPGDFVFDVDPAPSPKRSGAPNFRSTSSSSAWIKMPLGTEVNVGLGDVLDGVAAPLSKGQPPVFGSGLLWPNAWMDEDATWYRSRPRPRPHCIRRGPSSPRKGYSSPPLFGSSIVATVAHLSHC